MALLSRRAARRFIAAGREKWRHWLQGEAIGGVLLLAAAGAALGLANSPLYAVYEAVLQRPLLPGAGGEPVTLHFIVNDGLMTLFFLVAGVEIRQEIHNGVLSELKQAALPLVAAAGGVCLPALLYLALNRQTEFAHGWAVPTATDIAFAIGILALLGKAVPAEVRVILLSLAVIDDIIAVLIIAFCYSGGLSAAGALWALAAVAAIILLQYCAISFLPFYGAAAVMLWCGLWQAGIHPSLAGIILGLLVPVYWPAAAVARAGKTGPGAKAPAVTGGASPLARIHKALHLWVILAIMPLFAFVNAGVRLGDVPFGAAGAGAVFFGVAGGLWLGKPLGVLLAAFLAVKSGLCRLPPAVGWSGMALVGLLAGIGFTMALFVAGPAFADKAARSVAILAVLCGSSLSAALGLAYGLIYRQILPGGARQ